MMQWFWLWLAGVLQRRQLKRLALLEDAAERAMAAVEPPLLKLASQLSALNSPQSLLAQQMQMNQRSRPLGGMGGLGVILGGLGGSALGIFGSGSRHEGR